MKEYLNHAEICPVCEGTGKYKEHYNFVSTTNAWTEKICHGCDGKGWVTVQDAETTIS